MSHALRRREEMDTLLQLAGLAFWLGFIGACVFTISMVVPWAIGVFDATNKPRAYLAYLGSVIIIMAFTAVVLSPSVALSAGLATVFGLFWGVKVLAPLFKPAIRRNATVKTGVHNIGILAGPGYPKFKIVGVLEDGQTYAVLDEKKGLDGGQSETFYRIGANQWAAAKYLDITA